MASFISYFLKNALSWLTSNLANRLTATILFIALTNRVPLSEVGSYRLGLTFVALLLPLSGWGLDQLIIRDLAQNQKRASQYLTNFLLFRLCAALVSWGILFVLVSLIGYDTFTRNIVLVMGLTIISDGASGLLQAIYITFGRTLTMFYVAIIVNIIRLGLGLTALLSGQGAMGLAIVFVGASVLGATFHLFWINRHLVPLSHTINLDFWRRQLRLAHPFVLIDASMAIEFQIGQVLLSVYQDENAVGLYAAAFTIVSMLTLVAQAYMFTIFPIMSRAYQTSKERLGRVYNKSCQYLLLLSLPLITAVSFMSQDLLGLIYPNTFQTASLTLSILVWSTFFTFLNIPNSRLMIITDRQNKQAVYMIVSALTNILLNLSLISHWGIEGAAVARVVSSLVFFLPNYWFVYRHIHQFNLLYASIRPLLATIVMAAILSLSRANQPWLGLITSSVAYTVVAILLQAVPAQDFRLFIQTLRDLRVTE